MKNINTKSNIIYFLFLATTFALGGCVKEERKEYRDNKVVDYIVADTKKPYIKEIVIDGRNHTEEELAGNFKVRSDGGYLRYKSNNIFGWWSSLDDEKTYQMNRIERIITDLRISDRDDFIREYKDKKYKEIVNKEIVNEYKNKFFHGIDTDITIKDNINYFIYSGVTAEDLIINKAKTDFCDTNTVIASKFDDELDLRSHILRIAAKGNDTTEFNGFYKDTANMEILRVIQGYKGSVRNHYIGQFFDIERKCAKDLAIKISENAVLRGEISIENPKKSLRVTEITQNKFDLNINIDKVDFVGGILNMKSTAIKDLYLDIDRGVIGILNIGENELIITDINIMFNGKDSDNRYHDYILPNNRMLFNISNKNADDLFLVKGYEGGELLSSIEIKYIDSGIRKRAKIDLEMTEMEVWNSIILGSDF